LGAKITGYMATVFGIKEKHRIAQLHSSKAFDHMHWGWDMKRLGWWRPLL